MSLSYFHGLSIYLVIYIVKLSQIVGSQCITHNVSQIGCVWEFETAFLSHDSKATKKR